MAQQNNPYYVDPGNDYSQALSGLGNTISNARQIQIQNAEQQRRQNKEDRAQQRFQEVQQAAIKAFQSQNPDEIAKASIQYPEITEMLRQTTGLQDDLKNREALDFTRKFATASPAERPQLYERRIKSIMDRGGDPSHTVQSYQDYMQNPEAETRDVIGYWAGIDPKGYSAYSDEQKAQQRAQIEQQKAQQRAQIEQQKLDQARSLFNQAEAGRNQRASTRNAITGATSGAGKPTAHMQDFARYQELKNSDPEAAKAFGQAAGFVSKEGRELSPGVQLRLAKTIDSAVSAENDVNKFNNLADQMEKSGASGGFVGNAAEALKEFTGSQDAISDLRKSVAAVRAAQASGNLPPGAASDADVKIAFGPMPSDNASPAQWSRYLRAQANVQQAAAKYHGFKADYISDTGSERGMLQAWKAQGKAAAQPASKPGSPPAVTSQAQFDALPSGAVYMEDGQQYRKP